MEQNKLDKIELRSEKVQNIIGKVSPVIIRSGIGVLSIIFILLIAAMCLIPYPETESAEAEVTTTAGEQYVKAMLPYKWVSQICNATSVKVELEGYDFKQLGLTNAFVSNIERKPIRINGSNYFIVEMKICDCPSRIQLHKGMKGRASFLLSNSIFSVKIFVSIR